MGKTIAFDVLGRPVPKGSQRHVPSKQTGRPVYVVDPRLAAWEDRVRTVACIAGNREETGSWPTSRPVEVTLLFEYARPKSHLRASGDLKESAPRSPTTRNFADLDKLTRAILDGMTSIPGVPALIDDDAQVVAIHARKSFARADRVRVLVEEIG